jgi:hypothetical protein
MAETKLQYVSQKCDVEKNTKCKELRRCFFNERTVLLPNTGEDEGWETQICW